MSCPILFCLNPISDHCVKCFTSYCDVHLTTLIHPFILKIVNLPIHLQCVQCKRMKYKKIEKNDEQGQKQGNICGKMIRENMEIKRKVRLGTTLLVMVLVIIMCAYFFIY